MCIVYDKLLKRRQSFRITLYIEKDNIQSNFIRKIFEMRKSSNVKFTLEQARKAQRRFRL